MITDWNALYYRLHSTAQEDLGVSFVEKYPLKGCESLLDVGCGDGRITAALAARVPEGTVLGIDPSPSMVAATRGTFSSIKNLTFMQSSAEGLQFGDRFDGIVSFSALHYVRDHQKVLDRFFKALKPGGSSLVVMASGSQSEIDTVLSSKKWQKVIDPTTLKWGGVNEKAYSALLKERGFVNVVVKKFFSRPRIYTTSNDLLRWVLAWLPFVTGLTGQQAHECAADVVTSLSHGVSQDISVSSPLFYATAQRPKQ